MKNSLIWIMSLLVTMVAVITGCSKMDDTYRGFLEKGVIKYVGKADSVQVLPGYNRLHLRWLRSADPSVSHAMVYWNNRTDSVEINIEKSQDTIVVPLENMPEGSYTFEIITFDDLGNNSVTVEAIGRTYGEQYENTLLPRIPEITEFLDAQTLKVFFTNVTDTTMKGTELIYRNNDMVYDTLLVSPGEPFVVLNSFSRGWLKFRSFFKPSPLAIDQFYTGYDSIRVKGLPIELDKTGWIATASSFDNRSGSRYRPASLTIDNNPSTIWVNQVSPQTYYPHWVQVDMGQVQEGIEGFAIITRVGDSAARPKTAELLTSLDGIEWTSFGDYILESISDMQYLSIPEPVSVRYFKVILKNAHSSNENNAALAEIGLFTR